MNTRPGVEFSVVRLLRIARHLYEGGVLTTAWVMRTFGVSHSTAKKDLQLVGMYLPVEIIKGHGRPQAGQRFKVLRLVNGDKA